MTARKLWHRTLFPLKIYTNEGEIKLFLCKNMLNINRRIPLQSNIKSNFSDLMGETENLNPYGMYNLTVY